MGLGRELEGSRETKGREESNEMLFEAVDCLGGKIVDI